MFKFYISFYIVITTLSCKENNIKYAKINANIPTVLVSKEDIPKDTLKITKKFVLGKFNYRNNEAFVKVKSAHSSKTIYLQKETYKYLVEMFAAAKKAGVHLKVLSGTRNFYEQKAIWERKWEKYKKLEPLERSKKILEYSSMPTTSRHHWGTDVDLNNFENAYFETGKGLKEYQWLITNANDFGFYQVYTSKKNGRTGYKEEKWHWTYLPLAKKYLSYYNKNITYEDINGFKGANLAIENQMIVNYVNGVSDKILSGI